MSATPWRALIRRGLLALGLSLAVCYVPMFVRLCYGTVHPHYIACTSVSIALLFAASLSAMIVTYRLAEARRKSPRFIAIASLSAAVPVTTAYYVVELFVIRAWPEVRLLEPNEPVTVGYFVATGLSDSLPLLAAWAGLFLFPASLSAQEERQRELALVRREADVLRLRSHLEPHFVLNTLNAVSGFVAEDPPQAHELLAALGDLFREANSFSPCHRVADEVAWLRRYVMIHELRHPDLLDVEWQVGPEALAYGCPALITQPLVENALTHGAFRSRPSRLKVRVAVGPSGLLIEVRDNGPALGPRRKGGKGLAIVERRLLLEGGEAGALSLRREGDETVALVRLPARPPDASHPHEAHAI